ncbi:MAG: acetamidase/formamidase family protein [Gammaproteobacteria bacterium]|nr:acetamidase/formamidase family protein [Gammaproteobacteria bacterium]
MPSKSRHPILLFTAALCLAIAGGTFAEPAATPCLPYLATPPNQASMLAPKQSHAQLAHTYILPATPATTQWGVFDSAHAPVLTINSGDTVVIETMAAADNMVVPGGANIAQIIKMNNAIPGRGPHTLTGPIYINDAEPGDVLKIHFNKIIPRPYASNDIVPGKGLFPKQFPNGLVRYFYLDVKKMQMQFAPGIVVPLAPFPGVVAVARAESGSFNSIPPGPFGGNMDLRELTQGTTLYLPVFKKGALLWTGDSHAGQGNGEIDLTAIETAFAEFSITVELVKHKALTWPRAETKTDWIAVGYDKDINKALSIAKSEAIKLIVDQRKVSKTEAEKILFSTWNCPISEVVDELQGVYCMVPKKSNVGVFPLPTADTQSEFVTVGKNADLEEAMKTASMAMIKKLEKEKKMDAVDAYMLSSFALDCRIEKYVSGDKTVHCMMPKRLWTH